MTLGYIMLYNVAVINTYHNIVSSGKLMVPHGIRHSIFTISSSKFCSAAIQ